MRQLKKMFFPTFPIISTCYCTKASSMCKKKDPASQILSCGASIFMRRYKTIT